MGLLDRFKRSEPGNVTFYLYFPSQQAADDAAAQARELGLEAQTPGPDLEYLEEEPDDPMPWPVICEWRSGSQELDSPGKARASLRSIAKANGGQYDGWAAGIDADAN